MKEYTLSGDGDDFEPKYWNIFIKEKFPLQKIRDYRNSLIHSNVPPKIIDGTKLCLPSIDKIN
jgi:hypothetical protein